MSVVDEFPRVDPLAGAVPPPDRPTAPALQLVRLVSGRGAGPTRTSKLGRAVERFSGVVLLFAVWELASRAGWLDDKVLAAPSTVLRVGWDLTADATLPHALAASLRRVVWGLVIGIPLGSGLALIAGLSRVGDAVVDRNMQMLRFVPVIGLQSVLILWLGIGESAKVCLIVIGVAFPIYVNTYVALRSLNPGFGELSDVLGLSRGQRLRRVILPGVLPGFLVGLRMSAAVAWLVLVFAEQINATSGIGYLIIRAQTFFQSDVIVLCLVIYAVLGLISDSLVRLIERKALSWQPGR